MQAKSNWLSFLLLLFFTSIAASAQTKQQMAEEVWLREIQYWQLVEKMMP